MSDVISKFERIIDRINILYGLMVPVGLMTVVAIATWVYVPDYFQAGSLPIYITVISTVAIVFLLHLKHLNNLSNLRLRIMYAIYHVALITFCIFVAPYQTPYEFLWIALAVGMDMVFKKNWMYLTLGLFAITSTIMFFRTNQPETAESMLVSILQFIGVFTISFLMSRYRRVSDGERFELAETSQSSTFERQRLLSLINNMGEAVIATDQAGKILIYNAATLNLLDTNQSLEHKMLDSVLKLKDKNHKHVKIFSLIKKSELGLTSTDLIHEFGTDDFINIYINAAQVKLGFQDKSESGYIIIMRDITKEKSLEEERDEFISVVSHELRTPVAIAEGNISNALFMSTKKSNPKVMSDSLTQAHDQVLFLSNMINDLATLSRAERTDVALQIENIDLNDMIHGIQRDYDAQATAKGLKLTISAAKDVGTINSEPLYLREILQNFVTNSIKYTKKGNILVHVRKNSKGDAVFSVADTGIGLSKADRKRVFEKFFRSEDFRTRESSGTGLGLYVTSKLAHRINAKIDVESELNKGSTFTITVPSLEKSRSKQK